jgi:hypothetical protein
MLGRVRNTEEMTAQIPDTVVYRGHGEYALVGISGYGLFDPGEHGLRVGMIGTACWRGLLREYTVEDGQLFLTALELGVTEPPAELFGAHVRRGRAAVYRPIQVRQPFTGGLLLGARFIHDLYVHMGHQPAWKYATVLELSFDDGQLASEHDRSELMARRRATYATRTSIDPLQGSNPLHPTDPLAPDAWTDDIALAHGYSPML